MEFFQNDYQMGCSGYEAIVDKWSRKLKPGNLLTINYHDIARDPQATLKKIWNLLAIDENWMPDNTLINSKINARKGSTIPDSVSLFLGETLEPQIQWFEQWAKMRKEQG